MHRFGIDPTGGTERDQFTETVAGHGVGANAKVIEYPPCRKADGTDRGLGDARIVQGLFVGGAGWVGEDGDGVNLIAEALAVFGRAESCIGFGERVQKLWKLAGQIAEHADILRALTGEDDGEFTDGFAGAKVRAIGCCPGAAIGMAREHLQRAADEFGEVGGFFLKNQNKATLRLGAECGSQAMGFGAKDFPRGSMGVPPMCFFE